MAAPLGAIRAGAFFYGFTEITEQENSCRQRYQADYDVFHNSPLFFPDKLRKIHLLQNIEPI
jgi:hypothetical protein